MRRAAAGRIACLALLAGAVALSASGCSSAPASPVPPASAAPTSSAAPTPSAPAPTAGLPTATPPGTPVATTPLPPSPSAGGGPTTPPGSAAPASPFLPIGGPGIGLLTPEQGVGQAPRFEWTAVTGAARYLLFVFDPSGRMYWAWEGTETSVYLGGFDQSPKPGTMGPTLTGPMSWAVIAYDAGGKLIASSPRRPVAP